MDDTTEAMTIGDSITNSIDGRQIGLSLLRRGGFGGHRISGLLERTANRAKKVKQVTSLMGISDCLSADFDIKLVYTYDHRFKPETKEICALLPLRKKIIAFRKEIKFSPKKDATLRFSFKSKGPIQHKN